MVDAEVGADIHVDEGFCGVANGFGDVRICFCEQGLFERET